jgi:general secretion pathway protein K
LPDKALRLAVKIFAFSYFSLARQRKVGAAPHRGDANKPEANQGKATKESKKKKNQTAAIQTTCSLTTSL